MREKKKRFFFYIITYLIKIYLLSCRSLGVPEDERDGNKDKSSRRYRLEALHIRGFGKLTAEDIYEYFKVKKKHNK